MNERVTTNHSADLSDDDVENDDILDLIEAIDIDEIPIAKEPENRSERAYIEKTVRVVDHANRFASIKGRL